MLFAVMPTNESSTKKVKIMFLAPAPVPLRLYMLKWGYDYCKAPDAKKSRIDTQAEKNNQRGEERFF